MDANRKPKECLISAWECVYHACLSDDCQKEYRYPAFQQKYGEGECVKKSKQNKKDGIQQN